MFEPETSGAWLMRGIDDNQSFLFNVPVRVEEDEPGLFGASVTTMSGQMAASGRSSQEAFENAVLLFCMTVDDAIKRQISIHFATGVQPLTLQVKMKDAPKFLHLLESKLAEFDKEETWLRIPPEAITEHQIQ
jgi:hypothetical protein